MAKQILETVERWLSRAGHAQLLYSVGALVMPGVSGLVIGILAWWHQAPLYQIALTALFAMALVSFIANQSLRLITSWKAPSSLSRQEARRLDRLNPGGVRLGGNIVIVITILAAALIIVGGLYISTAYSTWKQNLDSTYIKPVYIGIHPFDKNNKQAFGIDIRTMNPGNLTIDGMRYSFRFEYPERALTADEEERLMRSVDVMLDSPHKTGVDIYPHTADYHFTAHDERFTKEQWDDFLAGKIYIYLFVELKYLVSGYVEVSEHCTFTMISDYQRGSHICAGHNTHRWAE